MLFRSVKFACNTGAKGVGEECIKKKKRGEIRGDSRVDNVELNILNEKTGYRNSQFLSKITKTVVSVLQLLILRLKVFFQSCPVSKNWTSLYYPSFTMRHFKVRIFVNDIKYMSG